jgi:hypothetical protein
MSFLDGAPKIDDDEEEEDELEVREGDTTFDARLKRLYEMIIDTSNAAPNPDFAYYFHTMIQGLSKKQKEMASKEKGVNWKTPVPCDKNGYYTNANLIRLVRRIVTKTIVTKMVGLRGLSMCFSHPTRLSF